VVSEDEILYLFVMASHSPALLRVKLTYRTSSKTTLLASLWLPVRMHLWPLCSFFCFFFKRLWRTTIYEFCSSSSSSSSSYCSCVWWL